MATQHETHSIVFETSPYGNVDAIVEHDGRSVYFYLSGSQSGDNQSQGNQSADAARNLFGMRACWVRNLEVGPHVISTDDMEAGIAPMVPRYDCVDPALTRLPTAETLDIVWLEEGNGAALYELIGGDDGPPTRELIAVIPPWSGLEGFHGYASNCANKTQVCWPMPDKPLLIKRIEKARAFWEAWSSETVDESGKTVSTSPFAIAQPEILANYRQRFGTNAGTEKYYAIDGGSFPLRGLVQHEVDRPGHPSGGLDVLATVGMSVCPQPSVEMYVEDPGKLRRVEVALVINRTGDAKLLKNVMQQISGLSSYPWSHFTWLGAGHTVSFNCGQFTAALLVDDERGSRVTGVEATALPPFGGDPVNLLWMLPITQSQQMGLQEKTLTVDQIVADWENGGA